MVELHRIRLLGECEAEDLERLEAIGHERRFAPETVIFREGERGDGVYLVLAGRVVLESVFSDKKRELAVVEGGDYFGEMAVLDEDVRSATARTLTETSTFFIPSEAFWKFLEDMPHLVAGLVREFSRRLRETNRAFTKKLIEEERLNLLGRFTQTIVHDLKNPISTIAVATELLEGPSVGPDQRKKYLAPIREQLERVNGMIQELIDFTRTHDPESRLRQVNFSEYFGQFAPVLRAEMEASEMLIEMENAPPPVDLRLCTEWMNRVFLNLVWNAADEMERGGVIHFSFTVRSGGLEIRVRDSGPGVPEDIAGDVFNPFVTHGKTHGSGLGLAICKRFVEQQGGRIELLPEKNPGAVFRIVMPVISASAL